MHLELTQSLRTAQSSRIHSVPTVGEAKGIALRENRRASMSREGRGGAEGGTSLAASRDHDGQSKQSKLAGQGA